MWAFICVLSRELKCNHKWALETDFQTYLIAGCECNLPVPAHGAHSKCGNQMLFGFNEPQLESALCVLVKIFTRPFCDKWKKKKVNPPVMFNSPEERWCRLLVFIRVWFLATSAHLRPWLERESSCRVRATRWRTWVSNKASSHPWLPLSVGVLTLHSCDKLSICSFSFPPSPHFHSHFVLKVLSPAPRPDPPTHIFFYLIPHFAVPTSSPAFSAT